MSTVTTNKSLTAAELRDKVGKTHFEGEDSTTPEGYYIIVTEILGSLATYLINKETDTLVGGARLHKNEWLAYASNSSVVGGYYVSSSCFKDFTELFLSIIAANRMLTA